MLHFARHRATPAGKLVVKILLMMVSFFIIQIIAGAYPAPLSAGALKASWNANTEPDLAGYKLYYGLASGKYTVSINVGKVTQYTVTQLNEEVVFYFVLTAYDTAGNESAYSQEVSAKISAIDRTPPSVSNVRIANATLVEVLFSEPVTTASAQNLDNYKIDNSIAISSAVMQSDTRTIKLATTAHTTGETYALTVRNIADRATPANVMPEARTFTYFLPDQPDDNPNHLGVESLSPARYDFASLEAGQAYYIDRPYVVMQAPAGKRGMLLIKTANTDRGNTAENFLSFTLTREKNVYVAYDSRVTQPPNWLKDSFTRTNETIVVSESAGRLNLWKIRGMSGRMTLGGNMAPGVQTNTSLSMYVVLIEDAQTGPDAQAPQSFVLKQNYPNPFSLTGNSAPGQTQIEYYLQEQHQVELKVHNTLGQVVRTLYSGLLPPGSHDLTWDGRDDRGELLPTGKYLCTLEVRDEMTNGELTMSASLNRQTKVMTLVK